MVSPTRYIMAQQRRRLMRVAKATGKYLVNEYAAFKLQTGEGITPFTCLLTYPEKVKPEIKKYFRVFLPAFSVHGLCWT